MCDVGRVKVNLDFSAVLVYIFPSVFSAFSSLLDATIGKGLLPWRVSVPWPWPCLFLQRLNRDAAVSWIYFVPRGAWGTCGLYWVHPLPFSPYQEPWSICWFSASVCRLQLFLLQLQPPDFCGLGQAGWFVCSSAWTATMVEAAIVFPALFHSIGPITLGNTNVNPFYCPQKKFQT